MRNLSMKKFGTPIGAGPSAAIDVVGLATVGTPCALRSGLGSGRSMLRSLGSPAFLRPVVPFGFGGSQSTGVGPGDLRAGDELGLLLGGLLLVVASRPSWSSARRGRAPRRAAERRRSHRAGRARRRASWARRGRGRRGWPAWKGLRRRGGGGRGRGGRLCGGAGCVCAGGCVADGAASSLAGAGVVVVGAACSSEVSAGVVVWWSASRTRRQRSGLRPARGTRRRPRPERAEAGRRRLRRRGCRRGFRRRDRPC